MNPPKRGRKKVSKGQAQLPSLQPVSLVTPQGLRHLAGDQITASSVGHKAVGVSTLPPGWTLPFFVVAADCALNEAALERAQRSQILKDRGSLQTAIDNLRLSDGALVIVRSSGTNETMRERGSLVSKICRVDQIAATISELETKIRSLPNKAGTVHWIVQQKAGTRQSGHLSNERRVKMELRDWVAEIEPIEHRLHQVYDFGIRSWRDGAHVPTDRLPCEFEAQLVEVLRTPAKWATSQNVRVHFEWVWDGTHVYLVQADRCEPESGVSPRSLIASPPRPPPLQGLKAFRLEATHDAKTYKKLGNAALYRRLGYVLPPFVVLDPAHVVKLLGAKLDDALVADLRLLTQAPLVLRTDGKNIPSDKWEMLPRSDELRTADSALIWLRDTFVPKILASGLASADICLLGHHYVPAAASAWANADPRRRMVRIEALWGIPEGLYWYSHDAFEVDTKEANPSKLSLATARQLPTDIRKRFKGTFVAPDADGHWVTHKTASPFDWSQSIPRQEWLEEIAVTSRRIAAEEGCAVNVMWLVDLSGQTSKHNVLPWFHLKPSLPGTPHAAPRRKISSHRDFAVRTASDWDQLQRLLSSEGNISRVTVDPADASLIRNPDFAKALARSAKEHNLVIELSGGILSHAYYVLTREGCSVECIDLFGADDDIIEFNKIVRDDVPAQITQRGEKADVVRLEGDALIQALKQKLVEESVEALDASSKDDIIAELADVIEVMTAICDELGITKAAVETERIRKAKKRGGFRRGLMLTRTSSPHTLSPTGNELEIGQELISSPPPAPRAIRTAAQREDRRLPMKPDLRVLTRAIERLVTFETEFTTLIERRGSTKFDLPLEARGTTEFKLEVELRRVKSRIRAAVKLVSAPLQFGLPLDRKR